MKQQEQVGKDLYQLAVELGEQVRATDRSLFPDPSMMWSDDPDPFPNIEAERQKLNRFLGEIRKHPGYIWLANQSDFNAALQIFDEEIRKIQDSDFEIARMRTRLLCAIAGSGWQLMDDSSYIPRRILKDEKERVVEIAGELLTFVHDGVGRPDYPVMQSLEEPLIQFIHRMQMDTRQEYKGPDYRQKEIAIRFALCLRDFGLIKSRVAELLASAFSIFDIDLGHRQAQRHVKEAFSR